MTKSSRKRTMGGGGRKVSVLLAGLLLLALPILAASRTKQPPFVYVGGTEEIARGCAGNLQLSTEAFNYECEQHSVRVPYAVIQRMQYRSEVTKNVRKLKLDWKVGPPLRSGGSKNRYFTVLYDEQGQTRVLVFEVAPRDMLPYLAEIELKTGKRVEVQRHEDY